MSKNRSAFKRYCKTLTLKDDEALIAEYKRAHSKGEFWPEITKGMKEVGILDMELYILDNRLFMIMDTVIDFDHEEAMKKLSRKELQAEWENYVARFQQTASASGASADEKWQLMERIYNLNHRTNYPAADGQVKECP